MQRDTLLVQQDECRTYRTKFEAYQQSRQRRMKVKKSTHGASTRLLISKLVAKPGGVVGVCVVYIAMVQMWRRRARGGREEVTFPANRL